MKSLILFILVLGLYFIFGSPYYYDILYNLDIDLSDRNIVILTGIIFAALTVLISNFIYNQREGFFFTLTPDRPRCNKITSGRPIGFEFTPDQDRICYSNQPIKDDSTLGYDGYLSNSVKKDCVTGGCVLPNKQQGFNRR
jgi:hypothetical protein